MDPVLDAGRDFTLWGLIRHADPVVQAIVVSLILCSVATWAIIFEKMIRTRYLHKEARRLAEMVAAGSVSARRKSGLIAAIAAAVRAEQGAGVAADESTADYRARLERAMRVALKGELQRIEVGLPFLATVGSAAPFIGLFGTVWGIMHSFTSIAQAKDTSLAVVAPGIAEALFATAIGLAAAIPAVVAYNQFAVSLGRAAESAGSAIAALARGLAGGRSRPSVAEREVA